MLNRSKTRTGNRIGNVIVVTGWMIDAVLTAARSAPLKRQELLPHAAMVEQRNRAAVQQRQEVPVDVGLGAFRNFIADVTLDKSTEDWQQAFGDIGGISYGFARIDRCGPPLRTSLRNLIRTPPSNLQTQRSHR